MLIGPPGCGKTFIAKEYLRQNGINTLIIKGPEILNKYIGSSEKTVSKLLQQEMIFNFKKDT